MNISVNESDSSLIIKDSFETEVACESFYHLNKFKQSVVSKDIKYSSLTVMDRQIRYNPALSCFEVKILFRYLDSRELNTPLMELLNSAVASSNGYSPISLG